MKNYYEFINKSFDKKLQEHAKDVSDVLYEDIIDDEIEPLDEPIELNVVDLKGHYTPVISDDTWDVIIPRTNEMVNSLGFSDGAKYDPTHLFYVFINKKGGKDYVLIPMHKVFTELTGETSVWAFEKNMTIGQAQTFLRDNMSPKIQNWIIKKFPKTYGYGLRLMNAAQDIVKSINYTLIYKNSSSIDVLSPGDDVDSWRILRLAKGKIKKIVVEDGVIELESGIFEGFTEVTEVVLPSSLKKIGERCFSRCSKLISITLPEGLTKIGAEAFKFSNLEEINFPESLVEIGSGCFAHSSLKNFELPRGITAIPNQFMFGARDITKYKIIIPDWVTKIGSEAFGYLDGVSFYIPKSVITIESNAFFYAAGVNVYCEAEERQPGWDTSNFESTYSSNGRVVPTFHYGAYNPTKAVTEDINDDELEILDEPIELSVISKKDIIGKSKKVFEDSNWEIYQPQSKQDMRLLSSGTKWLVGYRWNRADAEYDDVSEESWNLNYWEKAYVIMNKSKIEKKFLFQRGWGGIYSPSLARYSCATWVLKQASPTMTKWFSDQNFQFVSKRLKITLNTKNIKESGTYTYPTDGAIEWGSRADIHNVVIVPGTRRITNYSLSNFDVKEIDIPDSVTAIGNHSMSRMGLTKLKLPPKLRTIEYGAFYENEGLTSVVIPGSVTKIERAILGNCKNLSKVYIPASVKTLERGMFDSWPEAEGSKTITVYCEADSKPEGWDKDWFSVGGRYYNWTTTQYEEPKRQVNVIWGVKSIPSDMKD